MAPVFWSRITVVAMVLTASALSSIWLQRDMPAVEYTAPSIVYAAVWQTIQALKKFVAYAFQAHLQKSL